MISSRSGWLLELLTELTKGSEGSVLVNAVWQMSRVRHRNRINPAALMAYASIDEKP